MRTSIGGRCTRSNALSRAVLITRASFCYVHASAPPGVSGRSALGGRSREAPPDRFYYGYPHVASGGGFASGWRKLLVALARGSHLFPFRTEPLSPAAPMVLPRKGGRVGRRQVPSRPRRRWRRGLSCFRRSPRRGTAAAPLPSRTR